MLSSVKIVVIWAAVATLARAQAPRFGSAADLETFLFSLDENGLAESMKTAFRLDNGGQLIGLAVKFGPAYASGVAAKISYPEFQEPYRDLAKYLDLYGPCQKKEAKEAGWWSNYPDPPNEHHCSEVTKLLLANLLWSQIHYCKQLVTGEAKPKVPVEKPGPWRLDEPPVQTVWLRADVLYDMADRAVQFHIQKTLRERTGSDKLKQACAEAATEIEKEPPNRELAALALAKVLVRRFEEIHWTHLQPVQK